MPLITWSNDLSVNIKEIDSQHKRLVDIINELHDAMTSGKGNVILDKMLSDLVEYTRVHFTREEEIMKNNGYPDFLSHKPEHDKLVKKVMELKTDFESKKIGISIMVRL